MEFIRGFSGLTRRDAAIAGGKGASLGEMTRAGIPVPPGFVVLAEAFEYFLEKTGLDVELDSILHKVDHERIHTVENASEEIHALVMQAEMPKEIAKMVLDFHKKLGAKYVAVRSSATAEDSSAAAWAGQLESYLNTTEGELLENVKRCWASLFTPRAIVYRFEKNLHKEKISVAVVIQKMVNSEESGIAFSVHPVTQDKNQIIIEAGFGLGEAVVSGQITPDSYVIEKEPRKIIEKNVVEQGRGLFRKDDGGNEWKSLAKEEGGRQVLSDKEILELTELIIKIEKHYGFPCDIEWAKEKNKFYIVQSRPITTLTEKKKGENTSEEREIMVSHRSKLFTQDVILKGAYQYCKFKDFGATFDFPLIRYEHSTGNISYPKKQVEELKNLHMDKETFTRLTQYLNKEIAEYKIFIKNFEKETQKGNNKEKKVIEYLDRTFKTISIIPYFAFELSLSKLLKEEGISEKDIPSTATYASRSSEELIKIANKHKKSLNLKGEINKELRKDLENFCKKFGYLGMQYFGGTPWEVEEAYDMLWNLKDQKRSITKEQTKINSPYVKIASDLLYARTQNWETMCYGCYLFRNFILRYFPDIPYNKLLDLRVDDFLEIIQGRASIKDKLVERDKFVLEIKEDGVYLDEEAKKSEEKIEFIGDTFKGVSAQQGKVKGIAKIVFTSEECTKVNLGDILVTPMSTPDFLPAMNKAAAFVTDIGGITSHAAIIARELKKPCVIGTKIATSVLKDGDLVEVDADKGIVTLLNKTSVQEFHKMMNRSFPLIFFECWYKGERFGLPRISENSMFFDPLFIYRKNKGTDVLYNFTDKSQNPTLLVEYFTKHINCLKSLTEKHLKNYQQLIKLSKKKKYFSMKKTFSLTLEMLPVLTAMVVIGNHSEERAEIVKISNKTRTSTEDFVFKSIDLLLKNIARLLPKEYEEFFYFLTYTEIIGELPSIRTLKQRREGYIYYQGKVHIAITEEEFAKKHNLKVIESKIKNSDEKEIKGNSAYHGKITGKVRVVFELKDMKKIEKGEILVTSMTTPDLIAVSKDFSAIVTDEGGIISHAAIIARELKIPCIIGTKIATSILNDGDLVEVDADKGIVRILDKESLAGKFIAEIGNQEIRPPIHTSSLFVHGTGWTSKKYFEKTYSDKTPYPILVVMKDKEGIVYLPLTKEKNIAKERFAGYWKNPKQIEKIETKFREFGSEMEKLCLELSYDQIKTGSSGKVLEKARKLQETWVEMNAWVYFSIYFDKEMLEELVKELKIDISQEKIDSLWEKAKKP